MRSSFKVNILSKGRDWISFRAEKTGSDPITEREAITSQADLGYHPLGYGFEAFRLRPTDGGFEATWKCSSSCD